MRFIDKITPATALIFGFAVILWSPQVFGKSKLRFRSGFEGDVYITKDCRDIRGSDGMDWQHDIEGHPEVKRFTLNFIGESPRCALAEIRPDPVDLNNRVLYFQLNDNDPNSHATTRTQNEWNFQSSGHF